MVLTHNYTIILNYILNDLLIVYKDSMQIPLSVCVCVCVCMYVCVLCVCACVCVCVCLSELKFGSV